VLISLFITCYNDTLFPETGKAVVRVLERLGHEVEFRRAQTCCGQMHINTGYRKDALGLLRKFVEDFRDAGVICIPSASCVATIREQYPSLAFESGNSLLAEEVAQLIPRIYEFSELLTEVFGVEDCGAWFPHAVTFHPSCHSLRSLHAADRQRRLLSKVAGIELRELPECDQCCGFGGTFSIKNADVSAAMLEDKLASVRATGAEVVAAGDNSCLMHIAGGLHREGSGVQTRHLAEILASIREDG
jgi:L-lactate dehydrogenase complex protein LldE